MSFETEFISATDKPALLALSTPEYQAPVQLTLAELGYKVHVASGHDDFMSRFGRVSYQVVVFEELFAATTAEENLCLQQFQCMPMALRRYVTSFLIGTSFQTLHSLQAYRQSVHAVINPAEFADLPRIFPQITRDQESFIRTFRDSEAVVAKGKG